MSTFPDSNDRELFFGRDREMERFSLAARDLSRGWGKSVMLLGRPGTGKTELLLQFHRHLFSEAGAVVPVYLRFDPVQRGGPAGAAAFVESLAVQYLAFRRQDLSLARTGPGSERLKEELRREDDGAAGLLRESCRRFAGGAGDPDMGEAALLPAHLAGETGWKFCLLFDDMHNLAGKETGGGETWPRQAFRCRSASLVFTGDSPALRLMERLSGPGAFETWPLEPLAPEGSLQMARSLLRAAGIELPAASTTLVSRLSGGFPVAIETIVRGLDRRPGGDEASTCRSYSASVCRGDFYRQWKGCLEETFPGFRMRKTALEVLVYCLREGLPPDAGRLAEMMIKERSEVTAALVELERAGLVSIDCTRIRVQDDPTLRDFLFTSYEREAGGRGGAFVEAELAARKLAEAGVEKGRALRTKNRVVLDGLLKEWNGQQVPGLLFRAGEFGRKCGGKDDKGAMGVLRRVKSAITLPDVVSVAAGRTGPGTGPAVEMDALAWAFHPEGGERRGRMCWAARIDSDREAGPAAIEDFSKAVSSLETGGELENMRVVRWFIARSFSDEALQDAEQHRIMTSTFRQVQLLGNMLGVPAVLQDGHGEDRADPGERLDFEMVIPMVTETELVAARAIEQVAENMRFDAEEVGRIKMAIVEACINAFEHSGREGGKVRLRFSTEQSRLLVRVENRGRAFSPGRIVPVSARREMTKRGWGLSLIRELMDEVEFEPSDDGATIVMVKHLRGKEGLREQVRDDDQGSP